MTEFPITIYHNPDCRTSRNTLAMIEAAGYSPEIIQYRESGWGRSQLEGLMAAMGATPRDIMRDKGSPAAELGLLDPKVDDDIIIEAMIAHPILVNRPIVATPKGTKLCRPSEVVFSLLDRLPDGFIKEDGQSVLRS